MRFVLVLLSAFAFAAATAFAATTIDTTVPADWNGSQGVGTFGFPNTATYGQVITVSGNDSLLHDFTLFVNLPPTAVFRAAVYSWNASASRATGPSLYESAPRSTTTTGMLAEKFTPAAPLALTPNAQYVLLLSVSKDSGSGTGTVGYTGADAYTGGAFFSQNNGVDATQWTGAAWTPYAFPTGGDLAFVANFDTAVAATAGDVQFIPTLNDSLLLLLAGATALAGAFLLRRR